MSTLGERLSLAMEIRGVNASQLDKLLGNERSGHAGRIARGDRPKIAASTAEAIAKVLHIDGTWLVTGEGTAPTSDDDLTATSAAPKPAPYWRLDPAWREEHALALQHRPDSLPQRYIDELGDHVVPGRRPTWPLILKMAEVLFFADLAESARVSESPERGTRNR